MVYGNHRRLAAKVRNPVMTVKRLILNAMRRTGYDLVRLNEESHVWRRCRLMERAGVNLILDVGANTGEFAKTMRAYFYQGRIVSFEPLRKAFGKLDRHARRDPLWVAENFALGDTNETRAINVAGNSASSSFLEMLPAHLESAPESHYVGGEEVRIRMLDDVFHDYVAQGDRVLLKADTQGYERNVLLGARGSLAHIELVQLEVSLRPLYDGDLGVADAIEMLAGFSFVPVSFEPGFTDKTTGKQLQANIIFQREN